MENTKETVRFCTKVDKDVQRAVNKKKKNLAAAVLVFGTAGVLAYIVLGAFIEESWTEILLVFAVPFALGLIWVLALRRTEKDVPFAGAVNTYEFDESGFAVRTEKDGAVLGEYRIEYKDVAKANRAGGYLVITHAGGAAFAADTTSLPDGGKRIEEWLVSAGVGEKGRKRKR